ncbi:competence/damage-inducible protein A [Bacillus sp. FJAT-45037]|uniref:competence/damage-inducible protein A n=1 Tax=Bacillus sp. FJAT-45037 TaxID=2011007 RepID=UPI000C238DAC|nr:competence/damage-inducible protein A [Bacillus sp. FJAT-45037]
MRAEIIAVGSELLLGQIVNTNARFLSEELAASGIDVYYQVVVGDNKNRLTGVIKDAAARSDLVFLTGGLGPTKDDLTKETVATFLGKNLVYDDASLASIEAYFQKVNRDMTPNNKKQALIIEGSQVLPNHYGMAPGMIATVDGCTFVLLPGPPKELEPLVKEQLLPFLQQRNKTNESITSRVLRFFNIGESKLETMIEDLLAAQSNPTIAPLASEGEVTLRLTVKHHDASVAKQLLDHTEEKIQARVGQFFYGYGESSLIAVLVDRLKSTHTTLSTAESLTGGLVSSAITSVPGASNIFVGSIVSYQTKVKENQLGVSKELITSSGVVSAECAGVMAREVRERLRSDIGLSFTGVAGPSGQEGKEPGLVYIGIAYSNQQVKTFRLQLTGNRESIRMRAMKYGCFYLLNELKRWNLG